MGCKDEYNWNANHPNCEECPRYADDCSGDIEVLGEDVDKEVM